MRSHQPRSSLDGFTLLEAMTVVAIIGITAALAAPAMMSSIANRRAGEATHSVVRIGARARSEAIRFGRAHVLSYTQASSGPGGSYGTLELWRGVIDRCAANNWAAQMAGSCSTNNNCIDSLDMGSYAHPTNRVRMELIGPSTGWLCFQPNGDMFYASPGAGAAVLWSDQPPAGSGTEGVRFRIQRLSSGSPAGVDRMVVFPFGGTPRILR